MSKICILLLAFSGTLSAQWSTLPVDLVIPMNTSSPGTALTAAIANAGIVSSDCVSSQCFFNYVNGSSSDFEVGANQGSCANLGPVSLNGGSVVYSAGSLKYNSIGHFDADNNTTIQLNLQNLPTAITNITVGWCMTLGPPPVSGLQDYDTMIVFGTGGDYATTQLNACTYTPGYGLRLESGHPTAHSSNCIELTPQSTYWVSMNYNISTGSETLYVYTPQGTLVGSATVSEEVQAGETFALIYIGNNEAGHDSGTTTYFQNIMLDWTNHANPLFWTGQAPAQPPPTDPPPTQTLWSGVLAPSRATAWAPGVPGGIPNRTTICSTLTSTATTAQINSAISSCGSSGGGVVLLGAGTYSNVTAGICMKVSNVTLRGAGADQTILAPTSAASCNGSAASISMASGDNNWKNGPTNGPVNVTGNLAQGSATITLASVPNLKVGNPIIIDQSDSTSDTGGILVTQSTSTGSFTAPGNAGPYSLDGSAGSSMRCASASTPVGCRSQEQIVTVTQCDGSTTAGHTCSSGSNITISPALHMPNWSSANSPQAWWATTPALSDSVENLTVNSTNNSGVIGIEMFNCSGCWVKGVRSIDSSQAHIDWQYVTQSTVRDSYMFLTQNSQAASYGVQCLSGADNLAENNIFHGVTTPLLENGACSGTVFGYNYTINDFYTASAGYNIPANGDHTSGIDTMLREGNISNGHTADVIHGTANLSTDFRNYLTGPQPVCWSSGSTFSGATYSTCNNNMSPIDDLAYHRFYNYIGNVLGTASTNSCYETGCSFPVVSIGGGDSTVPSDPNVATTIMLWGNADSATGFGSPRFNCSEVPTAPAAAVQQPFANPCPASHTLPSSFYQASVPSWWPSAKAWPIIGPDISSGNILQCTSGAYSGALVVNSSQCAGGSSSSAAGGRAVSNPAMDCYLNTMGGNPSGTGSVLTFNANTCYAQSSPCTVSPGLTGPYTAGQPVSQSFTEAGCSPSTFTISSGSLTGSGLTLNSATGVLSGTAVAGSFSFTVAYGTASDPISLVVDAKPSITTTTLPTASTGSSYSQTLATSGGAAPIACALTSGSLSGSGLTLNSNCTITGAAATAGAYSFTATPTDSNSMSGSGQALSISVTAVSSGTPTLVQHVATGMDQNPVTNLKIALPNPAGAGNALILGIQFHSSGSISSVADNEGNTWVAGPTVTDSTASQRMSLYYALNVTGGTQTVTIAFSGLGSTDGSPQAVVSEFYNVAQVSAADGSSGSATSRTAGAITTAAAGDLIYHWGVDFSNTNANGGAYNGTSITAGVGFTLLSADLQVGSADQYEVQPSAGSVNPTFTASGSATWGSLAIALKSASAGTAPPPGIRIVHVQHTLLADANVQARTTPIVMQFPSSGNLLVGLFNSPDFLITRVSDSGSNTWVSAGSTAGPGANTVAQIVYAANASTSPTLSAITVTEAGTSSGGVMFDLYDITGAAASPFDKIATAQGDQTSSGNLTTTSLTPSTANGLVLNDTAIDFHTLNGIVGSGFVLDSAVNAVDNDAAGTNGTPDSTLDEDNGFAHIYNLTTSPVTFVYTATTTGTPSGVLNWGSVAAAFIAAPAGVGPPASPTALAVSLH